jgi:outer membrane protein assembly factor BamC
MQYTVQAARSAVRAAAWAAAATTLVLSGCSTIGLSSDKIDYRAVEPQRALDVPPDLTPLPGNDRYQVPGGAATSVTASAVASQPQPAAGTPTGVAPAASNARIERAGSQRWLAVDMPPEKAFEVVRDFWPSIGLAVERADPALGIVETTWAENRAKLPQDMIRRTLGRVFDTFYSTGEQDKFRARVERTAKDTAEIFVSHRGMVEVYTTTSQDQTRWQPRPSDPELEAEMLQRLALRFARATAPVIAPAAVQAQATAVRSAGEPVNARLVNSADGRAERLDVDDPFDRAWRRVGLALDRGGFTVEDRDRARGVYFVRFLDPDYEAKRRGEQGFFSKILGREVKIDAPQFRVQLVDQGARTAVSVLTRDGQPESTTTGDKILTLLRDQLR